ncbi:MAG: division/cell wall cluster transcriptional repressor MraZ [Acidobacteria bacterium]|nr:division/cell wall cluster transcriptional repressor MraZ [Acidobacteriota bacterium]
MARFRGRYNFSIDQKGRINIPSKFRKILSPAAEETFVISRGPDNCLWAYPKDEWEKYEDKLEIMPMDSEVNKFQRTMQDTVSDTTLDRQGRISLTPHQMKVAGINKDVSIIGRGSYLEIWDKAKFEEYTGNGENYDTVCYRSLNPRIGPAS